MKRNFKQKTLYAAWMLVLSLSFGLASCDDFLNVNTNPNYPEDASPAAKLPSIISNGFQQQYALSVLTTQNFTQHVAGRAAGLGVDQFFLASGANPFNDTYFRAASNIGPMIDRANREQGWYFVGAGKTLMAALLFHLTDIFGNIPYSDAFKGAVNYSPKYDSQESVYAAMDKLLDEAIVEFRKTQPASAPKFDRNSDILFQGDVQKWIRLCYSLKARQYNHLSKKAAYNPTRILEQIDQGIKTNGDDAQVTFSNVQQAQTNFFGFARANFSNRTFGRFFINLLNGRTLGARDPRFVIIAPDTARSLGAINGAGTTGVGNLAAGASDFYGQYATATPPAANTAPSVEGWYTRSVGVQMLVTNAEMRFVEAEAAFRANNRDRAYQAYIAGITAHCDKLGVPVAQRTAYLQSSAVRQSASGLTMGDIMRQKYIAMFLNPEAWVDMRRHDYSSEIYTGFTPPTGVNPQLMGQYPRRFLPGSTELLYNLTNAYSELGQIPEAQWITTPMWWDKP